MNKWYRLGKEFSKKYSGKDVYDFLRKNNLCNNFTSSVGKDFTEKHYKKMCEMVGISEEIEEDSGRLTRTTLSLQFIRQLTKFYLALQN